MEDEVTRRCECGREMWSMAIGAYDESQIVWRCDCGIEIRRGNIYGRWKGEIVAASGAFDPIHVGHIRYLKEARKLGCKLVVILNRDDWLIKKKGYVFMTYDERVEILKALKCVDDVVPQVDLDDTVNLSLQFYKPDIFAKGGDREHHTVPELSTCIEQGIKLVTGVGGIKIQPSSELVAKVE